MNLHFLNLNDEKNNNNNNHTMNLSKKIKNEKKPVDLKGFFETFINAISNKILSCTCVCDCFESNFRIYGASKKLKKYGKIKKT